MLQVLWWPSYEIEGCSGAVQLKWRQSSEVREVQGNPPEPAYVELDEQWPAHFTFRDPAESDELCCGECGGPVEALLSVDSSEWDGGTGSWRPVEDGEDAEKPTGHPYRGASSPTMVTVGRGYTLQFYLCTSTPFHLPRTIMQ